MLQDFVELNGRLPTKRDFHSTYGSYIRVFGNWNKAISDAGFKPNLERFSKRYIAKDGHVCDSLSEQLIDDWLNKHDISHEVHVYYPNQKKFKTDFLINNTIWIEFFGLKNQLKRYDQLLEKKLHIARENNIEIIEIKPEDIFPKNNLDERLGFLLKV